MPIERDLQPGQPWVFDGDVADAFDDMLARSIPQYEVMRDLVSELAVEHLAAGELIVDVGCSRGEALARCLDRFPARGIGLEVSDPMRAAATERFAAEQRDVEVHPWDLRVGLPADLLGAGTVLAVLTVQFVPIEHRFRLLADCRRALRDGGRFLFVEKVLGQGADADALLTAAYRRHKAAAGYTEDEIVRKAAALEGVLVPVTAAWNEAALREAGFRTIELVWRWGPFAAWCAIR